jgi:hypothetical protein
LRIIAKWNLSEAYYKGLWQQSLKSRTTFRRWVIQLALGFLAIGFTLFAIQPTCCEKLGFSGLVLSCIGIYEIMWHYWDKNKWFKLVTGGVGYGGDVELVFSENGITHKGPTSEGTIQWNGIEQVQLSETGLYLILQKGISMFVPFYAFTEQGDIEKVMGYYHSAHA